MESSTMERPNMVGGDQQQNPTTLRPGSLIYMWAPGEPQSGPPLLVRVERTTVDTIMGANLCAGGVRGSYGVSRVLGQGAAWTWVLAAETEMPVGDIENVEWSDLSLEERRCLVFGPPGTTVRVRLHCGDSLVGSVSRVFTEGEDIRAVEIIGPNDSRGAIRHLVKYAEIGGVTFQDVAR